RASALGARVLDRGQSFLPELVDQRRGGVRFAKARANVVDDRLDLRFELVLRRVPRRFGGPNRPAGHVEERQVDPGPDSQREDSGGGAELVADLDEADPRPASGLFEVKASARAVDLRRGPRYARVRPQRGLDQLLLRGQRWRRPRGRVAREREP